MKLNQLTKNRKRSERSSEIELLRFLFAITVVIFHAQSFYGTDIPFIGGSFSVEFFFLTSGYLMMQSVEKKRQAGASKDLGLETVDFLKRKMSVLFPESIFAWFLALALTGIDAGWALQKYVSVLVERWYEIPMVKMAGVDGGDINGVIWYISAMLLCMAFMYPLLRKYTDMMGRVILPLTSVLVFGWLYQRGNVASRPTLWYGFVYKGVLRAYSEMALGAGSFYIVQKLRSYRLTMLGRCIVTAVKWICFLAVFYAMYTDSARKYDYLFILVTLIGLIAVFSAQGVDYNWCQCRAVTFLGKFSVPLYLTHISQRYVIHILLPNAGRNLQLLVYLAGAILVSLCNMGLSSLVRKGIRKCRAPKAA